MTTYSEFLREKGVGALRCDRRFVGVELKPSYFETAVRNLESAEGQLSLLGDAALGSPS